MLDAYMDGQSLRAAFPGLIVQDIDERLPELDDTLASVGGRHGQQLLTHLVSSREVAISVVIPGKKDYASRARAIDQINRWAQGKRLTVSYRQGQHMDVICTQPAAMSSVKSWASVHTLVFAAYALPFWESDKPAVLELSGSTYGSGYLKLVANHRTQCCVSIAPASGTLTSVTFGSQLSSMTFNGISAAPGTPLILDYDDRHLLRARVGQEDVLFQREPESSDDLLVDPGDNSMVIQASTSIKARFYARGLWL